MAPCRFFARGHCTYGVLCKNSHETVTEGTVVAWGKPHKAALPIRSPNISRTLPESPNDTSELCWFFAQGTCTYGASCRKSHDLASTTAVPNPKLPTNVATAPQQTSRNLEPVVTSPLPIHSLNADVQSFVPGPVRTSAMEHMEDPTTFPSYPAACVFFAKGFCRNGSECVYGHDIETTHLFDSPTNHDQGLSHADSAKGSISVGDAFSKEMFGATVTFSAGAQVSTIKLVSDFSTIQILGLSPGVGHDDIHALLTGLGFDDLEAMITVKQLGSIGAVAEVKVEDAAFATEATNKFQSCQQDEQYRRLTIKPLIGSSLAGAIGNRLQLSTVSCSWYQASCVAWLVYPSLRDAEAALHRLQSRKIQGRVPDCSIRHTSLRSRASTLGVGNLSPGTRAKTICAHLKGMLPTRTTIGEPSYDLSNDLAASTIREKLSEIGALESFESLVVDGSNKMKALAVFVDRESASKSVRELHNSRMPELGNTKLFLNQVISVKYNVLSAIVDILKGEIDQLRAEIWTKSHASLKIYPQSDPPKQFTTMRLFGEGHKNIADAKAALEGLLVGVVVMQYDQVLWNPYFANAGCEAYLKELKNIHGVYIHRDIRKHHLIIHGGSKTTQDQVQQILIDKVKSLEGFTHEIILTPTLLERAMRGGMRDLKARFGTSVKLNISVPKIITITGSMADYQEAKALLEAASTYNEGREDEQDGVDCVVCWTEADDPLKMTCGHIYCKDCFNAQVSTNEGLNTVVCAEEKCDYTFEMDELKALLPYTTFENLRLASFGAYVRANSKAFQYCPTPDCPQLYRPTDNPTAVLCTYCLMSICTSCKVVYHDGMSCEDYKDLTSGGAKAFEKYKKETDTRDCPRCTLAIQKDFGCNHMECSNCKAHICWACMQVFGKSRECYDHMAKAHGSYGTD